jgi:hypothetical protein
MDRFISTTNTKRNVIGARRQVNVVSVKAVHSMASPLSLHARALCWRWTPSGLGASPSGF